MDDVSERLFTAKSLISQATRLMFGNILTVFRLSVGFIVGLGACGAATVMILIAGRTDFSPGVFSLFIITFIAILIILGAITVIRLYRFAVLGSRVELYIAEEIFVRRTWRFIWVCILISLQVIVLSLLILAPVIVVFALRNESVNNPFQNPLNTALMQGLMPLSSLPAIALMAVRYTLAGPAASIQDCVSFEALSTAGAPYRKDLILVVLLLVGAPTALSVGHSLLVTSNVGPAWISSAWFQIILSLCSMVFYLVFIGASSLAYMALRSDVERETEAVLSRKAYPEASAAATAQGGAGASSVASGPSPDAANDVSASGGQAVPDSKA